MAFIQFENLNKDFGDNKVLKNINLSLDEGNLITLLGPSGCGKSTLLRCLAGLEEVTSGKIYLDGKDITNLPPQKRGIGMVFQQYSLFPNMNVFDNIAFGLKLMKMSSSQVKEKVDKVIDLVDLNGKENAYPSQLSGGQQQRVALARSIVFEPKVLLLDEPLSAIDAKLRKSLQERIRKIQQTLKITTIFVTHDQDEAMIMSDEIHLFNKGIIEQSGNPIEIYTNPKTKFAAEFMGNYNIVKASDIERICTINNSSDYVAIRPETITLSATPPIEDDTHYIFEAEIISNLPHGNVLRYLIDASGVQLQVDVLFRSFLLFENHTKVYGKVSKYNILGIEEDPILKDAIV